MVSPYTLKDIIKTKKGEYMELVIEPSIKFFPEHENDDPLIYCLCEDVYIECLKKCIEY